MLRKACVKLALSTFTSVEFYLNLAISQLIEIAEDVREVNSDNGK